MKIIKNASLFLSMLFLPAILVLVLTSSNLKQESNVNHLEEKLTLLEQQLEQIKTASYRPGLGSAMLQIQTRHAKLAVAGKHQNWELAKFLIHELEEGFEDVVNEHPLHDEINIAQFVPSLVMPAITKMEEGIENDHYPTFNSGFEALTIACNSCHQASHHDYIEIINPEEAGFANQAF